MGKLTDKEKKKKGRPSSYSKEVADNICAEISTSSKSLKTICKAEGYPDAVTVFRWMREHEEFRNQYARAKEEQADMLVEEMLEIADDSSNDTVHTDFGDKENKEWVNRSKLRVDSRKWIASKLKPKRYGDRLQTEHSGEIKTGIDMSRMNADDKNKLLELLAKANAG